MIYQPFLSYSVIVSPAEVAILLDQLFMGRVLDKQVNLTVNASTFPRFYQQVSHETVLVSLVLDYVSVRICVLASYVLTSFQCPFGLHLSW